jgi:DNA-directed RNA polymerase subunit RPC12/RpoP
MSVEPFACPYCNSYVTVPADAAPGQRVACPRCGEAFPYRPRTEAAAAASPGAALATASSAAEVRTAPPRRANRLVAGIVLGGMAVMAAVGLVLALKTMPERRSRDRKELIGYLPGDVDVVALLQVTKTMETPTGRDFLRQFGLGPGGGGAINLEKWTGLRAEDMDLIVLGLRVKSENVLPRLTLAVETRQPYDVEAIRKALDAKRPIERNDKTLHPFTIGAFPAEFWCPTETILIIGLGPRDLDDVPLTPQPSASHLSPALQGLLMDRMGEGATFLLAADTDEWHRRVSPLLAGFVKASLAKADGSAWYPVQALGLWLRFEEDIPVRAAFRFADEPAAEALRDYLVKKDLAAADEVKIHQDKHVWLTVQTQTTSERLRQWTKRAPDLAPVIRGK